MGFRFHRCGRCGEGLPSWQWCQASPASAVVPGVSGFCSGASSSSGTTVVLVALESSGTTVVLVAQVVLVALVVLQ